MQILSGVTEFIDGLSNHDAAKILVSLKFVDMGRTEGLQIKKLRGKIYELVVNQYRIIFFRISVTRYVVDAFRKKTQKTPKRIIERAEKLYRDINN